jgi:hypothetical protein
MSDVTNGELMTMLIQISNQSAANGAKVDGINQWLAAHSMEDKKNFGEVSEQLTKLRVANGRRNGVLAALTTVGSVLGAGVGYAVELLTRGHH